MTTLVEQYRALVRRLYDKTRGGSLSWEITYNNEVFTPLTKYDVYLRASRDADGAPLEIVDLKNKNDEIIDSFDDAQIGGPVNGYIGINGFYDLMVALRQAARRNALGADKALDDVLKELDEEGER